MKDKVWHLQINALLIRIQTQDKQALNILYELTNTKLLATISCILSDKVESEDLLHDIYIKIWESAHKYSGTGTAWGWLCVLTRHSALDRLRKINTHKSRFSDNSDIEIVDTLLGEVNTDHTSSLDRCLLALKASTRKSIVLSYIYGYSHRELAQKISVPLGTVKAWIRRGVMELKTCLQR